MTWQKLKSKTVYQNRYMTVLEDELLTDHGDTVTYGVVRKEAGVSIIPFDGHKYYLIRQYRYPVNYTGWEFPAGHLEHKNVETAARAELEEEAGLKAEKLEHLGSYYEAPGHLDQEVHIYLATGLSKGKQDLDPAEKGIIVAQFTLSEINDLIRAGEIKDGLTIAALQFLQLHTRD